jgi:acyl-CoA synthetase (AMP-forming)/AMP-acid ligase II
MALFDRIETRVAEAKAIGRAARHMGMILPSAAWSPSRLLTERASRHAHRPAVAFLDRVYSWREVDHRVNATARALRELGVARGNVVALLMDNRPEYLFIVTALNRLGALAALINTNVTGSALIHALDVAETTACVVGAEHAARLAGVLPELATLTGDRVWLCADLDETDPPESQFPSLDAVVERQDTTVLSDLPTPKGSDRMCYIYTSGTTGFPKAAVITNQRYMVAGLMFARVNCELSPGDVTYMTTPLYHSVGMFGGWSAVLLTGACMALRRKFSASKFWDDVHRYDATVFVYIGELCRYLLHQPPHPHERDHKLRVASGNGLRPDIWREFQQRFGIPLIREYYGATEGTTALINLTGRPGMVGRLLPGMALVRADLETGEIQRAAGGYCETIGEGETGLLLGRISGATKFDGYVDESATKKKIVENVLKGGDRYFNTGDLLTPSDDGWVGFADRVGDTFRWKGENVSTNEVAEILNGVPGVLETNVYGVEIPGYEGRAGMASISCNDEFDVEKLADFVKTHLPGYQRPYFVRLQRDMRITGTFKHQKVDYRKEGYDPKRVADPLYFFDGAQYVPLDDAMHDDLRSGRLAVR